MSKIFNILKKPLFITLAVLLVISILLLIVNIIAPPIVKSYIQDHDKELIGRKITIEDIDLDVFRGIVVVKNAFLYEQDDSTVMASLKELYADIQMRQLLSSRVVADSIKLSGFRVEILQDGDRFNFSDIVERFSTPDSVPADTTPSAWGVILKNILIERSYIHYTDVQVHSDFGFTDLSLEIPIIDLADIKSKMGLHFDFMNGGSLDTRLLIDANKSLYNLWFDLNDFQLTGAHPYVRQFIHSNSMTGSLTTRLNLKGRTDHIMDLSIGGQIGIKNFELIDNEGRTIAALDTVGMEAANIYIKNNSAALNSLYLSGLKVKYEVLGDTLTNFTGLMVERSADADTAAVQTPEEPEKPWTVTVKKVNVANLEFTYSDVTLPEPFEFKVHNVFGSIDGYDSRRRNTARLNAHLQNKGNLKVIWDGRLSDMKNQKFSIGVSNLPLETFTPYTLEYTGYPLKGGTITLDDRTNIENNRINSQNHILIYHPEAGEKDASVNPEFRVPLKTCLYLLTDMNNKISVNLPVTGNLDDPKFSYRKFVVKAVFNVLLKALASPITAIANAANGGKGTDIADMLIEVNQFDFTASQYEQLDAVAELLNTKPELKIKLVQDINYPKAYETFCLFALKRDYLLSNGAEKPSFKDIQKVDTRSEKVKMFLWDKVKKSGADYHADVTKDAATIYGEPAEQLLLRGVAVRDSLVDSYLSRMGVPDSNYEVVRLAPDSIKRCTGANKYRISIDLIDNDVESIDEIDKVIDGMN